MTDRARLQALITPWQPLAVTAGATLLLLALFGNGDPGTMTWRLRLAGVAVAATTAFFLDDPAAATLASSPATLLVRRRHRFALLVTAVAAWWGAATVVLRAAFEVVVPAVATFELATTTAVSVAGAVAAARWGGSNWPGMVGAVIAPTWFALGYLPRPGWLMLPPTPGSAGVLLFLGVTSAAVASAIVGSRDPLSRTGRRWARR